MLPDALSAQPEGLAKLGWTTIDDIASTLTGCVRALQRVSVRQRLSIRFSRRTSVVGEGGRQFAFDELKQVERVD